MPTEILRLAMGLLLALFHRPIADRMLHYERTLVVAFHRRGLLLPPPPTTETARNVYFGVGIFIALFELGRIWLLLHRAGPLAALLPR